MIDRAGLKETAVTSCIITALTLMAIAPPVGFFMGLYTNNGWWFWLCGLLVFFMVG